MGVGPDDASFCASEPSHAVNAERRRDMRDGIGEFVAGEPISFCQSGRPARIPFRVKLASSSVTRRFGRADPTAAVRAVCLGCTFSQQSMKSK